MSDEMQQVVERIRAAGFQVFPGNQIPGLTIRGTTFSYGDGVAFDLRSFPAPSGTYQALPTGGVPQPTITSSGMQAENNATILPVQQAVINRINLPNTTAGQPAPVDGRNNVSNAITGNSASVGNSNIVPSSTTRLPAAAVNIQAAQTRTARRRPNQRALLASLTEADILAFITKQWGADWQSELPALQEIRRIQALKFLYLLARKTTLKHAKLLIHHEQDKDIAYTGRLWGWKMKAWYVDMALRKVNRELREGRENARGN